jgi:hypothetical protein
MYHHYSSRTAGCTCQDSNSALHRLRLMVLLSLGPLYKSPKETSLGVTLIRRYLCYGELNVVWKLITPHIYCSH